MALSISSRVVGGTTVVELGRLDGPLDRPRFRRDLLLHSGRGDGPLLLDVRDEVVPGYAAVLADVAAAAARAGRSVRVVRPRPGCPG